MEEKRKPKRWLMWLVVGLLLLIAYPLSLGPVRWAAQHISVSGNGIIAQCLEVFYSPLVWLVWNDIQPVADWLDWYSEVWQIGPVTLPFP